MSDQNKIHNWKKWCPKKITQETCSYTVKKDEQKKLKLQTVYFEKGFKLGIREGYQLKLKKKEFILYRNKIKLQTKMQSSLKKLHYALQNLDTVIVNQLLQIVLKISSKILDYPRLIDHTTIKKKIKSMLHETILSKKIIFKMHTSDKKFFEDHFGKILSSYNYVIHDDIRIQPGEYILDLEDVTIDSTSFAKWQELCRLFCNRELL